MTNVMDKFRELSASLKADADELRRDGVYGCCAGTYRHAAAHIDAILRESEAQGDAGAVNAKAWLLDVMGTWDFTMPTRAFDEIVNRIAASATPRTEPAEGREACPRDCGCVVHCRREQLQASASSPDGWPGSVRRDRNAPGNAPGNARRTFRAHSSAGNVTSMRAVSFRRPRGGREFPAGWHIKRIEDGMIIVSGPIGGVTVQEDRGRTAERVLWALADAILTDRTHGDGKPVAFRAINRNGSKGAWHDASEDAETLQKWISTGWQIEYAYAAPPAGDGAPQPTHSKEAAR